MMEMPGAEREWKRVRLLLSVRKSVIGNVALQNLQGFDARGERYLVVVSHQTFHHIGYPRKKLWGR